MTRLAGGLGAGVLTAGGSLVGFGVAVAVRVRFLSGHPDIYPKPMPFPLWLSDMAGSRTNILPLRIWLFATVVALVLAAGWGARGEPNPDRAALARVFGAFVGAALMGPFWVFARWNFPTPSSDTDVAVVVPIGMGVGLLFAGLVMLARRQPPLEVPTGPAGQGGSLPAPARRAKEHAPSYSLVASTPPLSADEVERAALALEVRVLWGGDVLAVQHLEPPRRFRVGSDASDFVVERPADAGDLVLVEVDGARVSATVPREVTVTVQASSGITSSLDRAIADGLAEWMDDKGGVRIPLALGARVSLMLRERGAGASYRAEQADADYDGQPLVFDVGLVRAGRVVGRRPSLASLRDPLRVLASVALVACGTLGLFRHAVSEPAPEVDEDGVRRDQKLSITQMLTAIDERNEAEDAAYEDDEGWQTDKRWRDWKTMHRGADAGEGWWWMRWRQSAALREDEPFLSQELEARGTTCEPRPDATYHDPACTFRVVTPYGLRGIGATLGPDPLGRDTRGSTWLEGSYSWGLGTPVDLLHVHGRHPQARVRIVPIKAMNYRHDQVLRVVRGHQAEFRECYERGLANAPDLAGHVTVRLVIDPEGNPSNIGNGGSDFPEGQVVSCVVRAFYGLSFPPPERRLATIYVQIEFAPH
jgi:hypothetical protein